jgi:large subunit ribosomal protein L10
MPLSKERKAEFVADIKDRLVRSKAVVFTDYRGLTVEEIDEVRNNLREKNIEFKVIKNTLFKRALEESGIRFDLAEMEGHPIAAVFGYDDEVDPAKITFDYTKKNEKLEILGGLLEGNEMNAIMVKSLAKLPGREELYAKVVGSLASPLSGTVNVLAGNIRGLINVLNSYNNLKS